MASGSVSSGTHRTQEVTVVEVRNPVTYDTNKPFTDYEVCIKTTNKAFIISQSFVRRRYSDFVWLKAWLQRNNEGFSYRKTPSLPPKKLVRRFDKEFIEERRQGLQKFLRKVIEQNVYLSDKALHLFLQSGMSVKDIEHYLNGGNKSHQQSNDSAAQTLSENDQYEAQNDKLLQIVEIPNERNSCNEYSSLASSSFSSIGSSLADSFEKINIQDCHPNVELENCTKDGSNESLDKKKIKTIKKKNR